MNILNFILIDIVYNSKPNIDWTTIIASVISSLLVGLVVGIVLARYGNKIWKKQFKHQNEIEKNQWKEQFHYQKKVEAYNQFIPSLMRLRVLNSTY